MNQFMLEFLLKMLY